MKTILFVFLIVFWTLMTIFSNVFDIQLSESNPNELLPDPNTGKLEGTYNSVSNFLDGLTGTPIIKAFVPLFKMLSFSYGDNFPAGITIVLDMTLLFSAYIVYTMVRGN